MKRNNWLILLAVCFYSFLFYRQSAGINFILFNLVLLVCLTLRDVKIIHNPKWIVAAIGSIATSLCIGYYGNELSVIANIISLSIASVLSMDKDSSVLTALISSGCAYLSSPFFKMVDWMEKKDVSEKRNSTFLRQFILIGIPVVVTLLFFFLYRASNPVFDTLAEKINLDFISIPWIAFTLLGYVLLIGFFSPRRIEALWQWDKQAATVEKREYPEFRIWGKNIAILDENRSGIILFVLLNILLLVVNAGDIDYLFITRRLPEGLTFAQFVHQGIDALIISIIIAILIVLFYFRGALNFFSQNKAIKTLACAWIVQNAFMVYSNAYRNTLYISEYGLTYKRIGVYIYLALAMVGLITTFIKIIKAKSNSYLFRANGWIFYALLVVLSFPDWAGIVVSYNTKYGKMNDMGYLFSLSDSTIPDLLPIYNAEKNKIPTYYPNGERTVSNSLSDFSKKLYNYIAWHDTLDWRSWCYSDAKTYNDITSPDFVNTVTEIDLSSDNFLHDRTLLPLSVLSQIKSLNIAHSGISKMDGIENLKNLETLRLSGDNIKDYTPLTHLTKLKELYVEKTPVQESLAATLNKLLPGVKIIEVQ